MQSHFFYAWQACPYTLAPWVTITVEHRYDCLHFGNRWLSWRYRPWVWKQKQCFAFQHLGFWRSCKGLSSAQASDSISWLSFVTTAYQVLVCIPWVTSPSVLILYILAINTPELFLSNDSALPSVWHAFHCPSGTSCHSEHVLPSKSRHLTTLILLGVSFRYCYWSSWDSLNEPLMSPPPADLWYQRSFWVLPSLFYFLFPSDCFSKSSVSSTPCSNSLSLYHGFSQKI